MATMYMWRSSMLKNWAKGYVIAIAGSIECARILVRLNFGKWINDNRDWCDPEQIAEYLKDLETDISVNPTTDHVLFINGSE